MAEAGHRPDADREKAIDDWEKSAAATQPSAVATDVAKVRAGLIIAALAAGAMGLVYWLNNGGQDKGNTRGDGRDELSLAERKPVLKLKEPETPKVVPAPPPAAPVEEDPLRQQREQLALQRAERERQLLEARRKSSIFPTETESGGAPAAAPDSAATMPPSAAATLAKGGREEQGARDTNSRFARAVTGSEVTVSRASQIDHLEYRILQGKGIQAVLEPRAISDLPGMLRATVQQDVYGDQGRNKLLPWGTRLTGVYNADVRKGQERLFVVWNRAVRPDGVAVTLDSAGADQLGTAGMGGEVDNHFVQIFGMSALLSVIGAGSATVGVSANDQYNSAANYRQAVQQAAAQTSAAGVGRLHRHPARRSWSHRAPAFRCSSIGDLDFTSIYQAEIDAQQRAVTGDVTGGIFGD